MSEQTTQLVDALRARLRLAIRRTTLAELAFGGLLTLGVLAALWLVSVAVEAGFWLAPTPRTVLFWGVVLVAAGLLGYYLLRPLLRLAGMLASPAEMVVAQRIGRRYPEVADRLTNLLDLVEGRHSTAPGPFLDGAVRMLGEQVRDVPFEEVEDFARARRISRPAGAALGALLLFLLAAPGPFMQASHRLFSPGIYFARPAPFSFAVEPGSVEVVKGASLDLTIRVVGTAAPTVLTLSLNHFEEEHVETLTLPVDSSGAFVHPLVNIRRSLRYRVKAEGVESPWFTVAVVERPLVRGLQVSLRFPTYTRIPPQRLGPNVGDVTALPGTEVTLDVALGGEAVNEAFAQFDDGTRDTLNVVDTAAEGSFTLHREGNYQLLLRNARGVENQSPITYQLKLLTDASPSVVLLEPAPLADLDENRAARLRLRVNDDFGFLRLRLYYRLAESRFDQPWAEYQHLDLPLPDRRQLDQEITYDWLLAQAPGLDPVPGDVIEYHVRVWDNDSVAGYKSAQTPPYRLRMPSLAEQYKELEATEDAAEDDIETLLRESDEVKKQFEELRDELRRKPEADWEDQRQLEQLQQRQEQLESQVDDLADKIESITDQMEQNNLVGEETMEMFQELQNVVEEINTPEMQEALKQLQEAMQNLNLQQMQQALENFQFNEEQYQQRLDRVLDLFKQLRVQQGLEEAARRAEELAKQEERLAEATSELMDEEKDGEDGKEGNEGKEKESGAQEGESNEGENAEGENQEGENAEGENQEGENKDGSPQDEARNEQLAKQQERAKEEMEALQEMLKALEERMEEVRNAPKDELNQMNEQSQSEQLPQQMQENADQLRENELQPAQQGQQQMQQQLQQMQQQLQQMQSNMQGQQMQMNMAGLRRALSDVLTLSEQQESLRDNVRGLASDSPILREQAQRQVELAEGLSVVSDSLQSLARNIPQMTRAVQQHAGEALREMGDATEAMAERIARRAGGHQKGAMSNLNELALLLSDLLNQMMNSQSSGSGGSSMQQMLQQLQDMAQQQGQLNQQIQQMLNDMQGNKLSQSMQQRLQQMSGQQQAIQNQLQEFSKNKDLQKEVLGDLNRIAEQMEESIRELQQRSINRETVDRQQQILTRLLDATRSMRERGKEKRREGRQGEDRRRESPPAHTPDAQADQLRRDLLRALESGYAPDYEELIKRYFELLQQRTRDQ